MPGLWVIGICISAHSLGLHSASSSHWRRAAACSRRRRTRERHRLRSARRRRWCNLLCLMSTPLHLPQPAERRPRLSPPTATRLVALVRLRLVRPLQRVLQPHRLLQPAPPRLHRHPLLPQQRQRCQSCRQRAFPPARPRSRPVCRADRCQPVSRHSRRARIHATVCRSQPNP